MYILCEEISVYLRNQKFIWLDGQVYVCITESTMFWFPAYANSIGRLSRASAAVGDKMHVIIITPSSEHFSLTS